MPLKVEFRASRRYREDFSHLPETIQRDFASALSDLHTQAADSFALSDYLCKKANYSIHKDQYILVFRVTRGATNHFYIELLTIHKAASFLQLFRKLRDFLNRHGEDIWKLFKKFFLDD